MSQTNTPIVDHTPGPWGWVSVPGATTIGIHGPTGPIEGVATVHARDSSFGNVTLANARLIAAAPELLAALKAASVQRDPRHRISMLVNDWERIETAVAKAEGRES